MAGPKEGVLYTHQMNLLCTRLKSQHFRAQRSSQEGACPQSEGALQGGKIHTKTYTIILRGIH